MEEAHPSFAEGWRIVWRIESLRRIWWSLPFLAASLIGFGSMASLVYDDIFGLDERARGRANAAAEQWAAFGPTHGAWLHNRLFPTGAGHAQTVLTKDTTPGARVRGTNKCKVTGAREEYRQQRS